jgi:hypothetical protein
LNNYYQGWAKKQLDAGLIDEPTYQSFMANKDYSRIQRDMTDLANPRGKGGSSYSLGTPTARQKRKGSARAIQPADITALNYAQKIQSEIQRNQTASNLIDVLKEQGHARNLVNADDVAYRRDMYNFLANTKEGSQFVNRSLKTKSRELRSVQSELDKLNKAGLEEYLRGNEPAKKVVSLATKTKVVRKADIQPALEDLRKSGKWKVGEAIDARIAKQQLNNSSWWNNVTQEPSDQLKRYAAKNNLNTDDALINQAMKRQGFDEYVKDGKTITLSNAKVRNRAAEMVGNGQLDSKVVGASSTGSRMTNTDTRNAVSNLISEDSSKLKAIRKKIANRDPKAATLLDEVQQLRDESEAFKTARSDAYNSALARANKSTTGLNTLKRVRNGITEVYEVPRDIKEVADQITPYQLGVLGRIISAPQRLLRAGATGLSAPFTVANYVKDQVGSAVFSKNFLATHNPASVFNGIYQASKDFGIGNDDKLWKRFIEHSGDATSVDFIRNLKSGKDISREIRLGQAGRAINRVKNPIRTLEDLNQITEKATRFQNFKGIYNDVLKKTGDKNEATRQATLAAWQNSTDFSRAGNVSQVLNLILPYFNASVQGTRTLGRKIVQNPVGTTAKIISLVALPVAAATMYNTSNAESKKVYDNISDYEKENNIIVVLPGAKQQQDGSYTNVVKIPLQQGIANLVQPLRHAVESFNNSNTADAPKMAAEFLGALSGPVNISSPSQAAGSLVPQAVKPLVQQYANQDLYTGKSIVPEYVNEATDASGNAIPEKDKTLPYTSGSADLLGKALNVSPIRVEKFIKDTSGKVGQYTQNAVDTGLAAVGAIPKDKVGGVSVTSDISRRFASAQGKENFQKSEGAKYF